MPRSTWAPSTRQKVGHLIGFGLTKAEKFFDMWTKKEVGVLSGKRLQKTDGKITMLSMGKSTISTGPCSIAMLVITRGYGVGKKPW